jgi:glycosyltransferase involved in cell wall biosynthesis
MTINKPFVSIGLPVYNGERFLSQALDSLLEQDYDNFEIIISDNASTDATAQISAEYAGKHTKIRYYRHESTIWATGNFNHVFNLSSAEYFLWASHNMYWDRRYLTRCMEMFHSSDNLVLAGAVCNSIDMKNQLIFVDKGLSTVGSKPSERFIKYMSSLYNQVTVNGIFYGIYKRSALCRVMPMLQVIANDHLMLAQLSLEGEYFTIQEPLITKRQGGMSATLKTIAAGEKINNPFFITVPFLIREILLQKIIYHSKNISTPKKIKLSIWSIGNYLKHIPYNFSHTIAKLLPSWLKVRVKRACMNRQH